MVSWSNHIGFCTSEGRHLVIVLLDHDIVAFDIACHVGNQAVIAKVAFPALLDEVVGVCDITEVSDELISTRQVMSKKGRLVERRAYSLFSMRL